MLRKNRIFVIGKDNDGVEVIFGSKIISRNFSSKDYSDIIKGVFSLNQPNNEGEVIIVGDRKVEFDYKEELERFYFKVPNNNVYDNIFIINQLDRVITLDIESTSMFFEESLLYHGITLMNRSMMSLHLDKKIHVIKNDNGAPTYVKDKEDKAEDLEYIIDVTDNLEEAKSMDNKMQEKLNSINEEERIAAEQYFTKRQAIESLFDVIRNKFKFKEPFGNYNSKVIIVVDFNKMDDKIIKLIKRFYEINSKEFFDIYLTPYDKTGHKAIDDKLLEKEIEFIKPDRIISLGYDGLNLGSESMSMSKADYDYFLSCVGNKDLITSDDYKAKKLVFSSLMKFIITGER